MTHVVNKPDIAQDFFTTYTYQDGKPRDYRHMNNISHKALGDAVTIYFEETLCDLKRRSRLKLPEPKQPWPQLKELDEIPRLRLTNPVRSSLSPSKHSM